MSRRITVLYLQPAPLFGGAERQAASLASMLPELGIEVVVMAGPGRVIGEWLSARGVNSVVYSRSFPGAWKKPRHLFWLLEPWRYLVCGFRAQREIRRLLETHRVDLVMASLPFAWITGWLALRGRPVPMVWRAGGARINWLQRLSLWAIARFMRPALLLCNAESVRRTFAPLVPAPSVVLPNGVDPNVFHPGAGDPTRYRPLGARWVIGCAGRLTRAKQPDAFVRVAAQLKRSHPDACFLLGGDGARRAELEELIERTGADNLKLLGFISDMPSFYAACDVVVLPSRAEGCPNFVLEAMAMAKPIVAAEVDPVLELVEPGRAALLYPYGDEAALAHAISVLLDDPRERGALAARAHRKSREFAARANAGRLAALSRELVQSDRFPALAPADAVPSAVRSDHRP